MKPKISIIVPFYNVQEYIEVCIESLLNQTIQDIEIILVNDGSLDDSEKIINKYIKKDKRIKYIKQKNQGLGIARNNGMKVARGEYIGFVDSDDYVSKDMFNILYMNAKESDSDISVCRFTSDEDDLDLNSLNSKIEYIGDKDNNIYKDIYFSRKYTHNAWDKIYKREIIEKNNITFSDNNVVFAEDLLFQISILNQFPKIIFDNRKLYYYRKNPKSIMNNYKNNMIERQLNGIEEVIEYFEYCNKLDSMKDIVSMLLFEAIDGAFINEINYGDNIFKLSPIIKKCRKKEWYKQITKSYKNGKVSNLIKNGKNKIFTKLITSLIYVQFDFLATIIMYVKVKLFNREL